LYKTKTNKLQKQQIMNRKILVLAIAAITCAGTCAIAQSTTADCCKAGSEATCNVRMSRVCADSSRMAALFDGITLSREQQTKIAEMRKARMEARRNKHMENRKAGKELRKSHLAEMKEVLTPEQYVVYLENIVVNRPEGRAHRNPRMNMMRGRHAKNKPMMQRERHAGNENDRR